MLGLAVAAALACLFGLVQCAIGAILVARFRAAPGPALPNPWPAVSVLKPLRGDEPLLEEALASFCDQSYPQFQIVVGVRGPDDPALAVVRRLQTRHPGRDLVLVIDPRPHGLNGKVSNLINMLPAARHGVLVLSDSDMHVQRDFLQQVVAALLIPGGGLATTLYSGLPAGSGWPMRLGATQITHAFLPGALLARALGRRDCLGATMALRRETLRQIGGFEALVDHLADDNELGRRVQALGLDVSLARTVPATTVAEASWRAMIEHELRWARTIRALVPGQFAASVLQYPIAWAVLSVLLSGVALWAILLAAVAWAVRAGAARAIDRRLGLAVRAPVWLLPLRDLLSTGLLLASYASDRVRWRGEPMRAGRPQGPPEPASPKELVR